MFKTQIKIRVGKVAYLLFKNKQARNNKLFKRDSKFSIIANRN